MKYNVKYRIKGFGRNLGFCGKGTVYIHGTALVLAGGMSIFSHPFLLSSFHSLVSVQTYRTIPYSKIARYDPAIPFLRRYHRIIVEEPGTKGNPVFFKLSGSPSKVNKYFARELEAHRFSFDPGCQRPSAGEG